MYCSESVNVPDYVLFRIFKMFPDMYCSESVKARICIVPNLLVFQKMYCSESVMARICTELSHTRFVKSNACNFPESVMSQICNIPYLYTIV
jgi:hypothetical protein